MILSREDLNEDLSSRLTTPDRTLKGSFPSAAFLTLEFVLSDPARCNLLLCNLSFKDELSA